MCVVHAVYIHLLHGKGNAQWNEEITYRAGKIFASYSSDRGLVCRIQKEHQKLDVPIMKDPVQK